MARRNKVSATIETKYKNTGLTKLKKELKETKKDIDLTNKSITNNDKIQREVKTSTDNNSKSNQNYQKILQKMKNDFEYINRENKDYAKTLNEVTEKLIKIINVNLKLKTSNNETKNSFKEVKYELDKIKNTKDSFNPMGKSFSLFQSAIKGFISIKISQKVLEIGKSLLSAASNMEELENVTTQVFGKMSKEVEDFAKTVGQEMGRSSYAMQKYVSDMGAVLKGFGGINDNKIKEMSESLTKLAVDIGSFKNVSDDQVFTALRGALSGETEALKTLGIVVNDLTMKEYALSKGIKEKWETMSISQKAELRYQAILEKTKFMHGDAARTIGSYANQLKVFEANVSNISATLGNKLKGNVTGVLSNINNMMSSLNRYLNQKSPSDYWSDFIKEAGKAQLLVQEYIKLSKKANESKLDNTEEEKRLRIYENLKSLYPGILNNISSEAKEYEKVASSIDTVIAKLKQKAIAQMNEDSYKDLIKEQQNQLIIIEKLKDKVDEKAKEILAYNGNKDFSKEIAEAIRKVLIDYTGKRSDEEKRKRDEAILKVLKEHGLKTDSKNLKIVTEFAQRYNQLAIQISKSSLKVEKLQNNLDEKEKATEIMIKGYSKGTVSAMDELTNMISSFMSKTQDIVKKSKDDVNKSIQSSSRDISRTTNKAVTLITNNQGKIEQNIVGTNLELTRKETIDIIKNRGVIEQFVGGIKTTFRQLDDGRVEAVREKRYDERIRDSYKGDNSLLERKIYKNYDEVIGELKLSFKKENLEDKNLYSDNSTKIKNKYEQIIDNLKTLDNELSTIATSGQKEKILKLSASIREKQIENIKNLESIGAISLSESIKAQIKAIEDELEKAKELKDVSKITELKEKINNLLLKDVLPSSIDKIINEMKTKSIEIQGSNLIVSDNDKVRLIKEIENLNQSNLILENKLKENKINEKEYIEERLKTSKLITSAYNLIGDKDKSFLETLNKQMLSIDELKRAYNQNNILINLDNILKNGNSTNLEEELIKSTENYYNLLKNKVNEIAITLFTEKGWDVEKLKTVYRATNKQLDDMINIATTDGDIVVKNFAVVMKKLKEIGDIKNKKRISDKFNDTTNDLIKGLQNLNKVFDGGLDGVINFITDIQNISNSISNISKNGFNFDSVTGVIGSVISIGSSLIGALFHKDEGKEKARKEYIKDVEKWNDELPKTMNDLRSSLDTLSNDIKNFNKVLIKSIASNTSNSNLLQNQKIAEAVALEYANSFDATVKTTISRTKETYRWWGWSSDTQYLGTETKEEKLRKILGIPEFKNANDIRNWYEINKNKSYRAKFENLGSGSSGLFGFNGYSHSEKLVGSNFNEVMKIIPVFADNVERIMSYSKNTAKYGLYESLDGINVTSSGEIKDQLRETLKKLIESSGQNWHDVASKIEKKLNELVKEDEILVEAFNDVRGNFIQKMSDGNLVIDSLATSLQGYFNKIRSNVSKIMYDLNFRENNDFEKNFIEKFKNISDELVKLRLENGKTIKDLDKNIFNFKDIFKQLKDMDKINNDIKGVVEEIRRQAKLEGISDDLIDKMLPLDKATDKVKDISNMLKDGMYAAIESNSFDQFTMSIGASLYKMTKEGLIKAFVETEQFKKLYDGYINTEEYQKELSNVTTIKGAYDLIRNKLNDFENKLKSEGLSFRETNASNGEYLGGFTNGISEITNNSSLSKGNINITVHTEIKNNGYISVEPLVDGIAEKVKEKIEDSYRREI